MTIRFSEWAAWSERANLPGTDHGGVYLIAKGYNLGRRPSVRNPTRRIIYIGYTKEPLRERLEGFDRSCRGSRGHQAGVLYFRDNICTNFDDLVEDARQAHNLSREGARNYVRNSEAFRNLLPQFGELWDNQSRHVKVAVWAPTSGWIHRFRRLPRKFHLQFVEAKLQVKFVEKHHRLPKYNRRFG